jgi:hypothetical protein
VRDTSGALTLIVIPTSPFDNGQLVTFRLQNLRWYAVKCLLDLERCCSLAQAFQGAVLFAIALASKRWHFFAFPTVSSQRESRDTSNELGCLYVACKR